MTPTSPTGAHEGGLSVRDQIERYRTAFISIVVMVIIAILDPTQEVLIGLASIVIPAVRFGGSATIRYLTGRR